MRIPLLNIPVIYHCGTLNKKRKGKSSLEGEGLSVSRCPEAWQTITPLSGVVSSLEMHGAQYIDYLSLDLETKNEIIEWAITSDIWNLPITRKHWMS